MTRWRRLVQCIVEALSLNSKGLGSWLWRVMSTGLSHKAPTPCLLPREDESFQPCCQSGLNGLLGTQAFSSRRAGWLAHICWATLPKEGALSVGLLKLTPTRGDGNVIFHASCSTAHQWTQGRTPESAELRYSEPCKVPEYGFLFVFLRGHSLDLQFLWLKMSTKL